MPDQTQNPQQEKEGLSAAEQDLQERGLYDQLPASGKSESTAGLSQKESTGSGGGNFSYNPASGKATKSTPGASTASAVGSTAGGSNLNAAKVYRRFLGNNKKKAAAGVGIVALVMLSIVFIIIGILPMKLLSVVNNLQSRFYATSQNAVEKETEKLFSNYVLGKILAKCRNDIIDQNCNPYTNKTLVGRLYRGWSDGRLEEKLKQQSGVEIKKVGNRYYMRFSPDDSIDLSDLSKNKTISQLIDSQGNWTQVRKNKVLGVYKTVLKGTTRHDRVMYYTKVTPYLAKKFGIRWCVIGCDTKDRYSEWKSSKFDDRRFGAKMWLYERVMGTRGELYAQIAGCLYSPDACSREKVINATESGNYSATAEGCEGDCIKDGGKTSVQLSQQEQKLVAAASKFGSDHEQLRKIFDSFEKEGFIARIFNLYGKKAAVQDKADQTGTQELGGDKESDKVVDAANNTEVKSPPGRPVVSVLRTLGYVYMAAQIAKTINDLPDVVAKMQYDANSAAMAQIWSMNRTVVDEGKRGESEIGIYGSFAKAMSSGLQPTDGPSGGQVGGTAGAECSPLYQALITKGASTTAGTGVSKPAPCKDYVCSNNKPVPDGQLVCDEEKLTSDGDCGNGDSFILCGFKTIKKLPGWGAIATAADWITNIGNTIIQTAFKIPLVGRTLAWATGLATNLAGNLADYTGLDQVFKDLAVWILGPNLSMLANNNAGARMFNMAAGGADVSGNSFAQHVTGGIALNSGQMNANLDYFYDNQLAEYRQKSFIAQITDKESPYSPINKLAVALPSNYYGMVSTINNAWTGFMSNPFSKIFNVFGSIFTAKSGAAGFIPGKDPFGVTQYGYPLDDPIFNQDPDEYWQKYCVSKLPDGSPNPNFITQKWNDFAAKNLNSRSFQPENIQTTEFQSIDPNNKYGTNGCLLIQTAVGSAGALFTDDVLSAEELAELQPETAPTSGGGGGSCSMSVDNSAGTADQIPSDVRDKLIAAINAQAPGRTCPDVTDGVPSERIPSDPAKQYFAYDGCGDDKCAIQNKDGQKVINVKLRDPGTGGNGYDFVIE